MANTGLKQRVQQLLSQADVEIGGARPWDLQVHNDELYGRVLSQGSLGFGEAYMDGWWDCEQLDVFFDHALRAHLDEQVMGWKAWLGAAWAVLYNFQRPSRAFHIGQRHYDIGNTLYRLMLGERMIYSCAYWRNASSLAEAQTAKLDLICRKLDIQPGMRVLDIGCGWGGTAQYIAEHYKAEVLGVTVSEEQVRHAREICQGLPVEIRLQDYRELQGAFDRIVSVGMFEHVGQKNYRTFMRVAARCLEDDGLMLLHTIGTDRSIVRGDPWIERYIFTNSMLPSAKQITAAAEGCFVLEDWHSFGQDYDRTLMSWFKNFMESWDTLKADYDERFRRMWTYYLLCCAGGFRARRNQLWQLVLSRNGVVGGYLAPR